jgi:hypothetical protein
VAVSQEVTLLERRKLGLKLLMAQHIAADVAPPRETIDE